MTAKNVTALTDQLDFDLIAHSTGGNFFYEAATAEDYDQFVDELIDRGFRFVFHREVGETFRHEELDFVIELDGL